MDSNEYIVGANLKGKIMHQNNKSLFKTVKSTGNIVDLTWKINSSFNDNIALICRGNKMRNWEAFSNEVSAVMQFPDYFSGGGNSLSECIRDLEWIFRKRIFVFITNANQILSDEPSSFLYFFERSIDEVPPYSREFCGMDKHVYYIFQNIDQNFPLFEDKDLSEFL